MLLGILPLVTLFAQQQKARIPTIVRRAAWYDKQLPTFAHALALVRKELWAWATLCGALPDTETVKVPRAFVERLTNAVYRSRRSGTSSVADPAPLEKVFRSDLPPNWQTPAGCVEWKAARRKGAE